MNPRKKKTKQSATTGLERKLHLTSLLHTIHLLERFKKEKSLKKSEEMWETK